MSRTNSLAAAHRQIEKTLRAGDAESWSTYHALSSDDRLVWRRDNLSEFFRLQRLAYHCFI